MPPANGRRVSARSSRPAQTCSACACKLAAAASSSRSCEPHSLALLHADSRLLRASMLAGCESSSTHLGAAPVLLQKVGRQRAWLRSREQLLALYVGAVVVAAAAEHKGAGSKGLRGHVDLCADFAAAAVLVPLHLPAQARFSPRVRERQQRMAAGCQAHPLRGTVRQTGLVGWSQSACSSGQLLQRQASPLCTPATCGGLLMARCSRSSQAVQSCQRAGQEWASLAQLAAQNGD